MRNLHIASASNAGRYRLGPIFPIANALKWPISKRLLTTTTTLRHNTPNSNLTAEQINHNNKIEEIRRQQVAANLAFLVPSESTILSSPATVSSTLKAHISHPVTKPNDDASVRDSNMGNILSVLNNTSPGLEWFHECLTLISKCHSISQGTEKDQPISSSSDHKSKTYESKVIQLLKDNKSNLTSLEIARVIKNLYHRQMHHLIRIIYVQVLSSIPLTQSLPTVATINYIMTASLLLPSEHKWRVCEDIFARYLSSPDLAYNTETFNLMLKYYTRVDMRLSKELFQQIVSASSSYAPAKKLTSSTELTSKADEIKLDRYTILIYLNGLRIKSRDLKAMKEVFALSRERLGHYNIFVCKEMLQGYLELCQDKNEFESFLKLLETTPHPQLTNHKYNLSLMDDKEIQLILMKFYFSSRASKFAGGDFDTTRHGTDEAFAILEKLLDSGIKVPYKYYQQSISQLAHNDNHTDTLTSMMRLVEIMTQRSGYAMTHDRGIVGSLIYTMSKELNNNDALVVIEGYLDRVAQILSQLSNFESRHKDDRQQQQVAFGGIQHMDAVLLLIKIFLEKYPFLRHGFLRRVRAQVDLTTLVQKPDKGEIPTSSKYYNMVVRQVLKLTNTNGSNTSIAPMPKFKNIDGNTVPLKSAILSNIATFNDAKGNIALAPSGAMWENMSRFNAVEQYTTATQDKELEMLAYQGHHYKLILQRLETRLRGDLELPVGLIIRILKGMERNGTNLGYVHKVLTLLKDYDQVETLKSIKLLILKFQLKRLSGLSIVRRTETTAQKLQQFYLNSKRLGPSGLNLHELHFLAFQYLKINQPLVAFELLTNDARTQIFELVGMPNTATDEVIKRQSHHTVVSAELTSSIRSIYMLLMRTVCELMQQQQQRQQPQQRNESAMTLDSSDADGSPTDMTETILNKYNMAFTSVETSDIMASLQQLRSQPRDEPLVELQEKDDLVKLLQIVHEYTTLTISHSSPEVQDVDALNTHGELPSVLMTKQRQKVFMKLLDQYYHDNDDVKFLIMLKLLKKLNVSAQRLQDNGQYMSGRLTEIISQLSL